jgi:hypothetical protein
MKTINLYDPKYLLKFAKSITKRAEYSVLIPDKKIKEERLKEVSILKNELEFQLSIGQEIDRKYFQDKLELKKIHNSIFEQEMLEKINP